MVPALIAGDEFTTAVALFVFPIVVVISEVRMNQLQRVPRLDFENLIERRHEPPSSYIG
jgi:hypothetical protein